MIRQLTILGVVGFTVMASNAMALAGSRAQDTNLEENMVL